MLLVSLMLLAASDPSSAKVTAKAAPSPDKIVCRLEAEVYSRIPRRVCRTQGEWEDLARQTQKDLENSRNDRAISPN